MTTGTYTWKLDGVADVNRVAAALHTQIRALKNTDLPEANKITETPARRRRVAEILSDIEHYERLLNSLGRRPEPGVLPRAWR